MNLGINLTKMYETSTLKPQNIAESQGDLD